MEHFSYLLVVFAVIFLIYLYAEVFILTPKKALEWWNSLSKYGQMILIERYLESKHYLDITDKDIVKIYRLNLKRRQL